MTVRTALALWAAVTVASWLLFGCAPAERQRQACLVKADAAKLERARELCAGTTWEECHPALKEQVRVEHREAMRQCP